MDASIGFHLHHGNRLELLAQSLAALLRAQPADPLAPDTVLVPHPGMAQWLKMRLADDLGVAANLRFPLPAVWFGRLTAGNDGGGASDSLAWSRVALAWRLYGLQGTDLGPLSDVAGNDERDRLARWQLAGQLARLFERYQLQRPDWLRAWLDGRDALAGLDDERWQQRLWRRLYESSDEPIRRALQRRLMPMPAEGADLPQRLFAFGFASLPQAYLDALQALSTRTPVHLFFANPCRYYWGDLLGEREQLAQLRRLGYRHDVDAGAEGHPLLAALGPVGRDFFRQLYAGEAAFASESECFESAPGTSVLEQLQDQLLELTPAPLAWPESDRSLRLLEAPTRRRELEALHDLLLDLLDDPALGLRPHEIAVLVPKLSDYAPLVEAVFGGQPPQRRIAYQLTDLAETERHPLPALFLQLLDLPVSRFGLGELLDALARPAFAAAFDIRADELPRLGELLEHAGARWGLDGEFRAGLGAGRESSFTFRFALERLLAGWTLGEDVAMADGVAPYASLRGGDADLIGRFVRCLATLDGWRRRLAGERTLEEWASTLTALRDDCLAESDSDEDNASLLRLGAALHAWREQAAIAGATTVPRRVVREALAESLHSTAVSALPGEGVNICAMVPLRGLPFRVVALLGLSEGEFPRREVEHPYDLCRRRPRPGDRSVIAEDRYLFLEALLSARSVLLLSHVDRDPERGEPRPAASVLAEFRDYLGRAAFGGDADALLARVERVAAAPVDARHFGGGGQHVPSFAAEWLAPSPPPVPAVALAPAMPETWREFAALFTDPALTQLRWRGVDLGGRDDPVEDCEPFALDGLGAYRVRDAALKSLCADAQAPRDALFAQLRAAALLPAAAAGARAFATGWDEAQRVHARWSDALDGRAPALFEGVIDLAHGESLAVRLDDADEHGLLRLTPGRLNGKRRLAAWLDLLALALLRERLDLTATVVGLDGVLMLAAPPDPQAALDRLLRLWRRARSEPLPIYPRASAEFAQRFHATGGSHDQAMAAAAVAWRGNARGGQAGECDDPASAELARCFGEWCAPPFAELALAVHRPAIEAAVPR